MRWCRCVIDTSLGVQHSTQEPRIHLAQRTPRVKSSPDSRRLAERVIPQPVKECHSKITAGRVNNVLKLLIYLCCFAAEPPKGPTTPLWSSERDLLWSPTLVGVNVDDIGAQELLTISGARHVRPPHNACALAPVGVGFDEFDAIGVGPGNGLRQVRGWIDLEIHAITVVVGNEENQ